MSNIKREILPMPLGGVGPDDIAIINCALCGDMCSGLPLCSTCWSYPDEKHQRAIDELIIQMPVDWPGRKFYEPRIKQAREAKHVEH